MCQRAQLGPDGVRNELLELTAELDGKSVAIRLPPEILGKLVKLRAKNFITKLSGFKVKAETVSGDKITRAQARSAGSGQRRQHQNASW